MNKAIQNNSGTLVHPLSSSEEELRKELYSNLVQIREKNKEKDVELQALKSNYDSMHELKGDTLKKIVEHQNILHTSRQHILVLRQNLKKMYLEFLSQSQDPVDVDNMTYEQLLELEEQIGKVSKGLSKSQVKTLNRETYKVGSATQNKCTVCQEEFVEDTNLIVLKCGHPFHEECIQEWLKDQKVCPLCKKETI